MKITLTVGSIASGKSTWAKDQLKINNNLVIVSKDDLRALLHDSKFSKENESFVLKMRDEIIKNAILKNQDVIIHDTNLNKKHFNDIVKICKDFNSNITIEEKFFPITLDESLDRNSKRQGVARVPETVVLSMHKEWLKFKTAIPRNVVLEKFNYEKFIPDSSKEEAVICDLDGTLSLFEHHRNAYDASRCDKDSPNEPLVKILKQLRDSKTRLIFCSGRMEKFKDPTVKFLDQHIGGQYDLFMRKDGDQRPDYIIKYEIFNDHIRNNFNIKCVFDDRLQVCKLYFNLGLNLFRYGDPEAIF